MGGGRARVEAHRRRTPHLDRSRHEERRRARAVPARVRLSDRLARAGQCRPRYRPLHAGAGNRWSICAGLRRARPCLLAEVRGKQRSAMAIEGARGVPHRRSRSTSTSRPRMCAWEWYRTARVNTPRRGRLTRRRSSPTSSATRGCWGLHLPKNTWATSTRQNRRTDVRWNAGRTTGPVARGSRPSIANRVDTRRPPSSSGKPSS